MQLVVTRTDGTKATARVASADLIAFERKFDKAYDEVEAKPRMEYVAFLAWNALRRTKQTAQTFDEFVDDLDDFEVEESPLAQ